MFEQSFRKASTFLRQLVNVTNVNCDANDGGNKERCANSSAPTLESPSSLIALIIALELPYQLNFLLALTASRLGPHAWVLTLRIAP